MLRKPIKVTNSYVLTPQWDPLLDGDDLFERRERTFLNLLSELNGYELVLEGLVTHTLEGQVTLEVGRVTSDDLNIMARANPFAVLWADAVVIRAHGIWYRPNEVVSYCRSRKVQHTREVATRCCANLLDAVIPKVLILMSCYLPESSRCVYQFNNLDFSDGLGCVSSFEGAGLLMMKGNQPICPELSFLEFFAWSRMVDGFWTGVPSTNVGRAMNFLSHAHHRTYQLNTLADISWIVAALEALLTESSQEIRAKVVRRAVSLAPNILEFSTKKEIGRVYDFRSSFLHGGLTIPNHFGFYDDGEYRENFSKAFDLASAVLFRCIQRTAENGWTELEFRELPSGSP